MLCFAHLMKAEDVEAVLDNRLGEIERYKTIFNDIEKSCEHNWPSGMKFVLGFGKAMSAATEQYINENRYLLAEEIEERSVTA